MKSRNLFLSFVLLTTATFFASCSEIAKKVAMNALEGSAEFEREDTVKWGPVVEQTLDLPAFTAIDAKGAGEVAANVFCQDLTVELNGAGHAVLTGECKNLNCEENGASKIDFSGLKR